jgi:hypothetical protein
VKIYKIISDIYFLSLYVLGVYYNPLLLYLIPLPPILILIFHNENSLVSASAGASMIVLDIFVLSSLKYALTLLIPLIILSIESSYREGVLPPTRDISFKSLGVSSIYVLSIIILTLFLAILKIEIIIYPFTLLGYLIMKNYMIQRNSNNININLREKYVAVRDHESSFIIKFINRGRYSWKTSIKYEDTDQSRLLIEPFSFTLYPNSEREVSLKIYGLKIGSYRNKINIRISDIHKFINRNLTYETELIIKPKLNIVITAGRRLIEAYGGGGIEEYSVESLAKVKSRLGEFTGVRTFIPGDDPRHIHFKKSAEHRELIIKEYEASGYRDIYLIVDTGVGKPEDLDDVLYNTVSLIISYLIYRIRNIGLIIFNSRKIILKLPIMSPVYILKRIIEDSERFKVYDKDYKFILEEPDINYMLTKENLAEVEYMLIDESYRGSILFNVFNIINKLATYPSTIVLIRSNSRNRILYPIFKHYLKKTGHEIKEFRREMRLEIEELARYIT